MSKELLNKRLWRVLGQFDTKEELINKVRSILEERKLYEDDIEEYIFEIEEQCLDLKKMYVLSLTCYYIISYEDVIKQEIDFREERKEEIRKRRQAQRSMNMDDYRIVQKQKQAEYLVEREMKRMAKMIGRKNLLSYKPKVYVLRMRDWNKKNCGGYVTQNNKMFLPEKTFKRIDFYDPYDLGLRKIIYKRNEDIVKTIRHELTHLFVKEQYRNLGICGVNFDASPIFIYHLAFFEGGFGNAHKVQSKYEDKICEEVQGNMTYLGVRDKCNKLLANLELVFDELLPYMTFTVDAEETYVNPNTPWLNVGYDIASYNLEKFIDLKSEWLEIISETSRKLAEKKEKEELKAA
ncbi:MAG: hypothetical protein ACRCW0_08255 [Clostridium sp.]